MQPDGVSKACGTKKGAIARMIRRRRNNYEGKTYKITDKNAVEWRELAKRPPEVRNRSQE
jgi:hypothetical protein